MSKHTPGPWVFETRSGDHPLSDRDGWGCEGLWAVNGGFIFGSGIGWEGSYEGPDEANARLIAAAPELLEALQSLEPLLEAVTIGLGRVWVEADGSETDFGAALDAARAGIAKATRSGK